MDERKYRRRQSGRGAACKQDNGKARGSAFGKDNECAGGIFERHYIRLIDSVQAKASARWEGKARLRTLLLCLLVVFNPDRCDKRRQCTDWSDW